MKKRLQFLLIGVVAALVLCGCAGRTVEDMYSIPKRSSEYNNLQSAIDREMENREYAAPVSGENQQTVQMADLTGDGKDEYLVFSRGNGDRPLQILIFGEEQEDHYRLLDTIEVNGSAFERVDYVEMDGEPGCELIVGRSLSNQVMRIASIFSFSSGQSDQVISTIYAKYTTCDLDSNGRRELMVIRSGEAETDHAVAVLYSYRNGAFERSREVELSEQPGHIKRIMVNKLAGGEPAVYVASSVNESAIVTDVFTLKRGELTNLVDATHSGTDVKTLRNYYVFSEDIDGDGTLELPCLITMKSSVNDTSAEKQYLIRWYSLDNYGRETDKSYTFHNYAAGWYLNLDSSWIGRVTVEREGNTYSFYLWDEGFTNAMPIFTVYTLTGKDRDTQASEENRFALHRGESVVYAAKLETASALNEITENYLTDNFHLIYQEWNSGEA